MAKINLLPEDFRQKDAKEQKKMAKRPKIFEVEFSGAQKDKRPDLSSDKPRQSWWQRVFGSSLDRPIKAKSIKSAKHKAVETSAGDSVPQTQKIDFKKAAKRAKADKQKFSWRNIFGKAHWPVMTREVKQPEAVRPTRPSAKIEPSKNKKELRLESKLPPPLPATSAPAAPNPEPEDIFAAPEPVRSSFEAKQPAKQFYRSGQSVAPKAAEKKSKYHKAPQSEKIGFDINLIPEELISIKYYSIRWQVFVVVLAVILPCLVIYGFYFAINREQTQINNKIASYRNQLTEMSNELKIYKEKQNQNIALQQKLLALSWLLKEKIYWSNFFNLLEKHTLDGVYYRSLSADTSGDFVLPSTADSYQTMAEQVVALEQADDFVDTVKIDGARLMSNLKEGVVGVMFDLKISLIDDVLKKEQL